MAKNGVDPLLSVILDLSDEPVGTVNGERTDATPHPIESFWHQATYGVTPPNSIPAPIRKKVLSVEEIEDILAKRRRERLTQMGLDLIAGARAQIRAAVVEDLIVDRPEDAEKLKLLLR
jgi:hypothetical protein